MITVPNTLKTDCNSTSLRYKEFIIVDSTAVEIKGKMSNDCYTNGNFIGTFIMKKLEFTTENDIDYKGKEVIYYKSVNEESFKIGTYIVTDVEDNDSDENVSVTAYDYGLKYAIPYVTNLNYASGTITVQDVLNEISNNIGVEVENIIIENGDFIVDSNQFINGEQTGTVIANIAGISCNFATINENDKLEFIFYNITDGGEDILITEDNEYILTESSENIIVDDLEIINDYTSLDDKRDTAPITCVSMGFSSIDGEEVTRKDNDLIALYGENWLNIEDNYFAYSEEKMELLIDAIFLKVKGFGYSSFESKYSFKPYMQLGDLIKFKNKNGDKIKSIILRINTDYEDIILSSPSITKSTISYTTSPDALTIAKNAQISVNKNTANILMKVNEDDFESAINLLSNEIDLKVGNNEIISKINLSSEAIKILANKIILEGLVTANEKFKVLLDGSIEANDALLNDTIVNNLIVNGGKVNLADDGLGYPSIEIGTLEGSGVRSTSMSNQGFSVDDLSNDTQGTINIDGKRALLWLYSSLSNELYVRLNDDNINNNILDFIIDNKRKLRILPTETVIYNDQIAISSTSGTNWIIVSNTGLTASSDLSDKRFKKNIENSQVNALDIISKIKHKEFDFNDKDKHIKNGFIAQELEKIDESLVNKTKLPDNLIKDGIEEVYTLNTLNILAMATKAIQELNLKVESLKKEIDKVKGGK